MEGVLQCMTMRERKPIRKFVPSPEPEKVPVKNIFVIYGNQNSGKTHTAWLVYNMLKVYGHDMSRFFMTHDEQDILSYHNVLQHIEDTFANPETIAISDFRAMIEIGDCRVAVFSAGDYVHDKTWEVTSFDDNMNWAQENHADYIVCCARSYNKKHSVHKYLKDNYSSQIYKWYYKKVSNNLPEQMSDAEQVAHDIVKDMLRIMRSKNIL